MNTSLQTVQFNNIPLTIIDHNGEGWFMAEEIGNALEYKDPRDKINQLFDRNRDELEAYSVTLKLTATDSKQYDTRVYNEEGVLMIGFLSKQPKAVTFRQWAVKILKAYRHKELAQPDSKLLAQLNAKDQQLITSLQAQIQFLQTQLTSAQNIAEGSMRMYEEEIAYTLRLKRARGKVTFLERQQIIDLHENRQDVAYIANWSGRSRDMIKKIIAGGRYVR